MSGQEWLAIDNIDNIRVYMVDCSKSEVDRDTDIEEFADEAERLGTVVTLPFFIGLLNDYDDDPHPDTPDFRNSYVRMAIVMDGKIVKEIEEDF